MPATPENREARPLRRTRLFWKLLFSFVAISIAMVLALTSLFARAYESQLIHELDERLRAIASAVGQTMSDRWPPAPDEKTQAILQSADPATAVRVTLIDMDGRVVADSTLRDVGEVKAMENHRDRTEFIEARRTGAGAASRISPTIGERMRYQAVRVDAGGRRLGVVRAALPQQSIAAQVAELRRWMLGVGAATVAGAAALACFIVARITGPLRSLATAADSILAGQYDQRVPVNASSRDETGALARAIGELRTRVARGEQQLRSTNQTQSTVLEGMTESVIAVDRHERILFANAAAARSLGFNARAVEGATLLEAVRSHELRAAVQQALRSLQPHSCEINWGPRGRRTFDVLAAPLPGQPAPGAVLVMRDITELKLHEQMRQQFIANVSHELKTPLSSIKAYTETLLGGARNDPEHCERFLKRIDEQSARLHQLIQDMLSLARIEAGQAALHIVDVPLLRVVRRCIADHEPQAAAGEVALEFQGADADLVIRADEDGLRQILGNLIDNAVKYTPRGGRIVVRCHKDETLAMIEVADTGIGMAAEHHSRVFERFYRVDLARSRELGGTGLGLSIVKHLCLAMGGSVSVQSELGKGSTFVVRLPLAGVKTGTLD